MSLVCLSDIPDVVVDAPWQTLHAPAPDAASSRCQGVKYCRRWCWS
jgi:hypothetical protein